MTERKMATIRKIAEIQAIPDADKICAYRVDGWYVVDTVGKYNVGDLVIYAEPDSWIPTEMAPFLSKGKEPRVYNGISGEKLKTVRLRGQISQGLLFPITLEFRMEPWFEGVGMDVTSIMGIQKYEAPISAQMAGVCKGSFPSRIPKTDQERIQNLTSELQLWKEKKFTWEITEKLEGSSMTCYLLDNEFGVCSRNMDLKRDENNSLWKVAIRAGLEEILTSRGGNIAIQGEIIGEGIQSNIYQLKGQEFYVFDIYDVDTGKYFTPEERKYFVETYNIKHVPILGTLCMDETTTVANLLSSAEGKSVMGMIGCEREGLVFKCMDFEPSFKAVSNRYLLKSKD